MVTFRIVAERLPQKWQTEIRQSLAGSTAEKPAGKGKKSSEPPKDIVITTEHADEVDLLVEWIRQKNREYKSEKTFSGMGIALKLAKPDGSHISLTDRNGVVVKQFLLK